MREKLKILGRIFIPAFVWPQHTIGPRDSNLSLLVHWKIVKIDLVTDIIASTQCGGNLLPLSTAKSSRLDWGINFQKSEHLLLKSLNPAKLRLVIFSQLIWMVLFSSTRDISEKHFRYLKF